MDLRIHEESNFLSRRELSKIRNEQLATTNKRLVKHRILFRDQWGELARIKSSGAEFLDFVSKSAFDDDGSCNVT